MEGIIGESKERLPKIIVRAAVEEGGMDPGLQIRKAFSSSKA